MEPDPDELAGVVDLFGGLTREELRGAYADLAARSGAAFDHDDLDAAIDRSLEGFYLVGVEGELGRGGEAGADRDVGEAEEADDDAGEARDNGDDGSHPEDDRLLVAGPASLPTLPDGGEDLPHLVDVQHRSVDRGVVGSAALTRLEAEAARAVHDGDDDRIATLLDVCYDLEAWAPVETTALRDRLDAAR